MEFSKQVLEDSTHQSEIDHNGHTPINNEPEWREGQIFRPEPTRRHISLDGAWQFQIDPNGQASIEDIVEWREAQVPMPWQAQFDDLREEAGTGWYRRTFEIPLDWAGRSVTLHFGAVDYYAQVWLDGTLLGDHAGGYLPFEFEIGDRLKPGETSELTLRVTGPIDDPYKYPEFSFSEIPHGKQSWYGPLNGIWQSVWLECRSPFHIRGMGLLPDLNSGRVQVHLTLSAPASNYDGALVRIVDPQGETVASTEVSLSTGAEMVTTAVTVAHPLAWSPDHPYLYNCEVYLSHGEEVVDSLGERFGFRTIETRDGRLFLNGELIYLRGALDQDYYPDTISTPPSLAFLEDQMRRAKELGLNCLRCHIKVADPRYYEVADRLGMLIWTELPNWRLLTQRATERGRATLQGIVERDGHHPSIIAWTIINEDWGTDLVYNASHRAWLKETYHWLKTLDPTRLVVDNSPCFPNFHVQTDLEDFHYYRAIPDHRRQWNKFVTTFASRPTWTFSPYGDAIRSGQEPLIVSEFGNWGLPDVNLLLKEGREPWWFETGQEWGDGVVHPQGVRRRFRTWHLDQVFGSWKTLIEATQWQQYAALKYEIETMRRQPEIAGYVITELTDVHWECNGLLDMRRNPKVFQTTFANFNADTVIIPEWERVTYWAGEPIHMSLVMAHGAGAAIAGAELHWSLASGEAMGRLPVPHLQAGQVQTLDALSFNAPETTLPSLQRLNLELRAADGLLLASNHLDLAIFPQRSGPIDPTSTLWTPEPDLAQRLAALGYPLAPDPQAASAVIVSKLDETLAGYIREGGCLLMLANQAGAIGPYLPGAQVVARADTPWQGDWASSFSWVRRQGPFVSLPGGPLLDHSFDQVIPEHVLTGFNPLDFAAHVHAGLFVGWIHKPVALIAERRYGQGRAVLTTFRLTADAPGADPTATTLLDALIRLTLAKQRI